MREILNKLNNDNNEELSNEELSNEELIKLARHGDNAAKDEFFLKNKNFPYHIAKKYCKTYQDLEELGCVANIGLVKAYETFNLEKGVKFLTYAGTVISNEILMYLRKNKKHNIPSIHRVIAHDNEGSELTYEDILCDLSADIEQNYIDKEEIQVLSKLLLELSDVHGTILHMLYKERKTQREVAEVLGYSQSYISRMEKKALKELRKLFEKENSIEETTPRLEPEKLGKMLYLIDLKLNNSIDYSMRKIGELCGVPSYTVGKYCKEVKAGRHKNTKRISFNLLETDEVQNQFISHSKEEENIENTKKTVNTSTKDSKDKGMNLGLKVENLNKIEIMKLTNNLIDVLSENNTFNVDLTIKSLDL